MILIIYLIGCLLAAIIAIYTAYKQYQDGEYITLDTLIYVILQIMASWGLCATYFIAYLMDKSDEVIIKKPKNKWFSVN